MDGLTCTRKRVRHSKYCGASQLTSGCRSTACDASCGSCTGPAPNDCTTCTTANNLLLNGTCIAGPTCPTGFFISAQNPVNNATATTATPTCMACHPDCEECATAPDKCTRCPSSRPVVVDASCRATCSATDYFDTPSSTCKSCDKSCGSCVGPGADECTSCPSSSTTTRLSRGRCVPTLDECETVPMFGVCLSELITVAAKISDNQQHDAGKKKWPWWSILLLVLVVVGLLIVGAWLFRRREQRRRKLHTAQFADALGRKEVDIKLARLDPRVANPPLPESHTQTFAASSIAGSRYEGSVKGYTAHDRRPPPDQIVDVPLTPRFTIGSPTDSESTTWSRSSFGGSAAVDRPHKVSPQVTGQSWKSNNPFNRM